jgi:hypothetical protein
MAAEPATLTLAEGLERRRIRCRRNRGVGLLHGHGINAGPHPRATLRTAGMAKLVTLYLDRVRNALRAGKHARPHLERWHRLVVDRRDASRRDARIDAEATPATGG